MTEKIQTLPKDYPHLTIINNINTKDDKKDDKKENVPGSLAYKFVEMTLIPFSFLTLSAMGSGDNPVYRLTYLSAMAAGSAFGLYNAMTRGRKVGLEQRATAFGKADWSSKAWILIDLFGKGPGLLALAKSAQPHNPLSNYCHLDDLVVAGWGFSLGADISTYVYNSLISSNKDSGGAKNV